VGALKDECTLGRMIGNSEVMGPDRLFGDTGQKSAWGRSPLMSPEPICVLGGEGE
jgi:hypothetical protein